MRPPSRGRASPLKKSSIGTSTDNTGERRGPSLIPTTEVFILSANMDAMILGAMGDAHGRKYIDVIKDMKDALSGVQLLLLAGDMSEDNSLDEFSYALSKIRKATDAPIVAVFGNDEWEQSRDDYRKKFDITFLDAQEMTARIDGCMV